MVGWGIEVINTSPELNKSGMLTAYKVPQRMTRESVYVRDLTAGNLITGTTQVARFCRPPKSAAEAALLPHSVSWEAKEGAYVPVSISGVENVPKNSEYLGFDFSDQMFAGAGIASFGLGSQLIGAGADVDPKVLVQRFVPFDTVGVFLTNLDPKSTFTIRVKTYFEKFPGTYDDVLLPMCTPSPRYDIHALAVYSELLHDLPIATKSENNANGDWFKSILKLLRSVGQPLLGLIPGVGRVSRGIFDSADSIVGGLSRAFPMMP